MKNLCLVQVNNAYGPNVYLPYSVGLLWAYANVHPEIRSEWNQPVFLYRKEPIATALKKVGEADVVAFSCYIWNFEWNRALARAIKEQSPKTMIVYGGVHVPDKPSSQWWDDNPEVDLCFHGEGEFSFAEFLKEFVGNRDWLKVPGISGEDFQTQRQFPNIDDLKSPYLEGTFEPILRTGVKPHVLAETNRGCPY